MTSWSRGFQVVVVIIIVIFVLVLYACIARPVARKTQQTACLANVHQLSMALQMYCSDNDGDLPPYPYFAQGAWPQVLRHYALAEKNKKFNPDLIDVATIKPFVCPTRTAKGYGYGLNWYVIGGPIDATGDVSRLILLAEASEVTDQIWWVNDVRMTEGCPYYQPRWEHLPDLTVHPGGGCVVFFDGRAKVVRSTSLAAENWLPNRSDP